MTEARRVLFGPWPVLVVGAILATAEATGRAWVPLDVHSYWDASFRLGDLYPATWVGDAYNYAGPPPMAQLFSLVHGLPFELVVVVWVTFLFGCLWYATRAFALPIIAAGLLGFRFGLPFLGIPLAIVLLGNAGMLLTAGVVASVRHPAAVGIPFGAKVGPAVALLYHHDRRAFLTGLGAIAALLAVSVLWTPSAWPQWVAFGLANFGHSPVGELAVPFLVRAPLGAAIVWYAGRTRRPWLVPIGAGLVILADYGASFLTVWVGALGLAQPEPQHRPRDADERLLHREPLRRRRAREGEVGA